MGIHDGVNAVAHDEFGQDARQPSHHRVHHGSNQAYIDKNYGGVFIVWDRLFGTYAEEIERCATG